MTVSPDAPLVAPFAGLRAAAAHAPEIAAPPYDVVSRDDARRLAAGKRWSFLHVSRADLDLPDDTAPGDPTVYTTAAKAFRAMIDGGTLVRDETARLYVYRTDGPEGRQTGIVGAASVGAYAAGRIRRHELTRPSKETDRVRHMEALGAQTGPVFVLHRPDAALDAAVERACAAAALCDARLGDVTHRLWAIDERAEIAAATAALDAQDALYIADGHHRAAAAARVAGEHPDWPDARRFLVVSFPADAVHILGYHRVVRDLAGRTAEDFLAALDEAFVREAAETPVIPAVRGQFGVYVAGRWFTLRLRRPPAADGPVIARLDVSHLTAHVLTPLLGIGDPRRDPRIDFVGGGHGPGALTARVDRGEAAAAFTLFPPAVEDLIAVADAGEIMPPKSTWFEPKLADGLISHVIA